MEDIVTQARLAQHYEPHNEDAKGRNYSPDYYYDLARRTGMVTRRLKGNSSEASAHHVQEEKPLCQVTRPYGKSVCM